MSFEITVAEQPTGDFLEHHDSSGGYQTDIDAGAVRADLSGLFPFAYPAVIVGPGAVLENSSLSDNSPTGQIVHAGRNLFDRVLTYLPPGRNSYTTGDLHDAYLQVLIDERPGSPRFLRFLEMANPDGNYLVKAALERGLVIKGYEPASPGFETVITPDVDQDTGISPSGVSLSGERKVPAAGPSVKKKEPVQGDGVHLWIIAELLPACKRGENVMNMTKKAEGILQKMNMTDEEIVKQIAFIKGHYAALREMIPLPGRGKAEAPLLDPGTLLEMSGVPSDDRDGQFHYPVVPDDFRQRKTRSVQKGNETIPGRKRETESDDSEQQSSPAEYTGKMEPATHGKSFREGGLLVSGDVSGQRHFRHEHRVRESGFTVDAGFAEPVIVGGVRREDTVTDEYRFDLHMGENQHGAFSDPVTRILAEGGNGAHISGADKMTVVTDRGTIGLASGMASADIEPKELSDDIMSTMGVLIFCGTDEKVNRDKGTDQKIAGHTTGLLQATAWMLRRASGVKVRDMSTDRDNSYLRVSDPRMGDVEINGQGSVSMVQARASISYSETGPFGRLGGVVREVFFSGVKAEKKSGEGPVRAPGILLTHKGRGAISRIFLGYDRGYDIHQEACSTGDGNIAGDPLGGGLYMTNFDSGNEHQYGGNYYKSPPDIIDTGGGGVLWYWGFDENGVLGAHRR